MTAQVPSQDIVRGVVESLSDSKLVLKIPGTDYQIHLAPTAPEGEIKTAVGKPIKGVIHAQALRMFTAHGGGRFIEPIWGEPRIVAGSVQAVDAPKRRVLVDAGVPMWMTLAAGQPADMFAVGQLVNCYVRSGATFTPAT